MEAAVAAVSSGLGAEEEGGGEGEAAGTVETDLAAEGGKMFEAPAPRSS